MFRRVFFKVIAGVLAAPYIGLALRPLADRWLANVWLGGPGGWHDPKSWLLGHVPTATETVIVIGGECLIPAGVSLAELRIYKGTVRMESSGVAHIETMIVQGDAEVGDAGNLIVTEAEYERRMYGKGER